MSLARTFLSGLQWNGISSTLAALSQFVLIACIARFASAEEMGVLALAFVYLRIVLPFVDAGLSNALIQKDKPSQQEIHFIYFIQLGLGLFLFLLTHFLGPSLFFALFDMEASWPLVQLLSWVLIIAPLGLVHLAQLKKQLKFKSIGLIQSWGAIAEITIGLILIFWTHSIMSLVWAYIVRQIVVALSSIVLDEKIDLHRVKSGFKWPKDLMKFGLYDLGGLWINQLSTQIDKILVAHLLGAAALGIYSLAWDLLIIPLSRLSGIFNQTTFPVFSTIKQDSIRLGKIYHDIFRIFLWLCLPFLMVIFFSSELIVATIFGNGWEMVATILPILSIAALFKVFAYLGGSVILSRGKPNVIFWWNLIWIIGLSSFIYIVLINEKTLIGLSYAHVIAGLGLSWIWHLVIWKVGKFSYRPFFKIIGKGGLYIIGPAMIMWYFIEYKSNYLLVEIVIILVAFVVYIITIWFFERQLLMRVRNSIYHE